MRRLIVGCGYLGTRVADAWLRHGSRVAALTRSPGRAAQFQTAGIEPIVGDVLAPPSLAALPEADTLLYAVGYDRGGGRSQREVYVEGLRNVLAAAASRVGRLLYISSTSVYGQCAGEWVDESAPCRPSRANGQACLEAEQVVWEFFPPKADSGRGAIVLRLAGLYGPGRLLRRVEAIRMREPLPGPADAWLNLVHVDDAVRAVLDSEEQGRIGETYVVSDDRPVRRREYYERLASLVGGPPPQFAGPQPQSGEAPDLNKRLSNRRLREELGVELAYPTIDDGLPHALGGIAG